VKLLSIYTVRHETLHKCTGVHANVLSTEGSFEVAYWPKDKEESSQWKATVASLDSERDVILFPSENAIPAEDFQWTYNYQTKEAFLNDIGPPADNSSHVHENTQERNFRMDSCENMVECFKNQLALTNENVTTSSSMGNHVSNRQCTHKRRLVVLEASWAHGKTMSWQIAVRELILL
jgi:hypothetical protein